MPCYLRFTDQVKLVGIEAWKAEGSRSGDKGTKSFCGQALHPWGELGLLAASRLDNEFAMVGGNRHGLTFFKGLRLGLLSGAHRSFTPRGEPGRNPDNESFNGLWQGRVSPVTDFSPFSLDSFWGHPLRPRDKRFALSPAVPLRFVSLEGPVHISELARGTDRLRAHRAGGAGATL